ncbi:MAG TPA: TIM barrel protein [Vicinamibacterales bacterium]|jgi:sugar phosphate isomerase/epimerase
MDRRSFLIASAAAAISGSRLSAWEGAANVELGSIDGSVGGNQFTPITFLDYLSSIGLTWGMLSVPAATLGDEAALRAIRAHADQLGIHLQLAFGSVCPSSKSFNPQNGTLEEQVARGLKASQIFGATCMRCVLGGDPERPQISMHVENMINAVRAMRPRILDAGVKLAVENHGGDLQAREMKAMIEAVGPDVMGVCLDSGNPVWMLEDPHLTLETLIPYALTCHVRDSAVWKTPDGIAVRWVNMGEGNVDIDGWIRKFIVAKPGMPIIFENLVSGAPRVHRIYDPVFWQNWRTMTAADFSRFLTIAERGTPKPAAPPVPGTSPGQQHRQDLEGCVRYTRALLTRL